MFSILATGLKYTCTELEYLIQYWNAFDRVGIPLYRAGIRLDRVEMLSRGLECFLQGWNAFQMVGTISRGLECFRQSWNTTVHGFNAF
jgi:hypothetical protein